jgi:hypothetical protein
LRVEFTKAADRWSHVISLAGQPTGERLLSLEGDPTDLWPASPPFQELSQETLPDGRVVIFLVGKAGGSHWSASVEAAADPPRLVFDVACRATAAPARLGSSYRREVSEGDEGSRLVIETLLADSLLGCMERDTMCVGPKALDARKLPATVRWKYAVSQAFTIAAG